MSEIDALKASLEKVKGTLEYERNSIPVMLIKVTCGRRLYINGDLCRFNCNSLRIGNIVIEHDVGSIKFNVT